MTSRRSPWTPDAASILKDAHGELASSSRRRFCRRILSLGGLALLSGCDLINDESVNTMLRRISAFNDRAQGLLFDPAGWRRRIRSR